MDVKPNSTAGLLWPLGTTVTSRGMPLAASTAMPTWSMVESAAWGASTNSYTALSATYAGVVTDTFVDGVIWSSKSLANWSGVGVGAGVCVSACLSASVSALW